MQSSAVSVTKWIYIVEYQHGEKNDTSAVIGVASDRENCEGLVHEALDEIRSEGHLIVRAQACEVCFTCGGEGEVPGEGEIQIRCASCAGRQGPMSLLNLHPSEALVRALAKVSPEAVAQVLEQSLSHAGACPE